MRNYESRIAKLEQALNPPSLLIYIKRFGGGELLGVHCDNPSKPYLDRKSGESVEVFRERVSAEAERWSGLVIFREDRAPV